MKTPVASNRSWFFVTLFCILGLTFSLLPGCGGGGGGGGGANPVGPTGGSTFGSLNGTVRFNGVARSGVDVYLAQSDTIVGQGVSRLLASQVKAGVRSSILPDATSDFLISQEERMALFASYSHQGEDHFCAGLGMTEILLGQFLEECCDSFVMGRA